jgi:hypothetical protein
MDPDVGEEEVKMTEAPGVPPDDSDDDDDDDDSDGDTECGELDAGAILSKVSCPLYRCLEYHHSILTPTSMQRVNGRVGVEC